MATINTFSRPDNVLTFCAPIVLAGEGGGETVQNVRHVGGAHEHEPGGLV